MESPHTLKMQELLKRIVQKRKSNAGMPKPTLEEFDGDEKKHRHAVEIWRIGQDERAAQAVLDNAAATFTARENANRTMRRCQKRRREIEPIDDNDAAIRARRINDNNPANEIDERPWAERFPYQDSQKSRFLTSDEARQQHKNLCDCIDEFERIGKMARSSFSRLLQAYVAGSCLPCVSMISISRRTPSALTSRWTGRTRLGRAKTRQRTARFCWRTTKGGNRCGC
jgi:hypothetical protein